MMSEEINKYLWGLDISLSCTGVTVYDLTEKKFVYVGSFNTDKIYATKENKGLHLNAVKLKKIVDWVKGVMSKYPPYIVAIERMFSRFPTETQVIAKATGVIQCMLWKQPQFLYAVKTIKMNIIHGDATKEDVANSIKAKYNDIIFNNDDESDSFSVAMTFLIEHELIEWEKPNWTEIKKLRVEKVKKVKKVKKTKEKKVDTK